MTNRKPYGQMNNAEVEAALREILAHVTHPRDVEAVVVEALGYSGTVFVSHTRDAGVPVFTVNIYSGDGALIGVDGVRGCEAPPAPATEAIASTPA